MEPSDERLSVSLIVRRFIRQPCSPDGTTTISNYDHQNHTFSASKITGISMWLVSGLTLDTAYTVTAASTSCTSASSIRLPMLLN
jgi:hypothetical protein